MIRILGIFLLTIVMISCYEPVEDCLDINASNYNVNADNPCDDCCSYPTFIINFSYTGISSSLGDTLDLVNHRVVLHDFHFFLDNIYLVSDGEEIAYNETIEIDGQEVDNDFGFFNRGNFRKTLENFVFTGEADVLVFELGLGDEIAAIDRDSLDDRAGFTVVPDTVSAGIGEYVDLGLTLEDLATNEIYRITIDPVVLEQQVFSIPTPIEVERGSGASVVVEIDFQLWLFDIDLTDLSATEDVILANVSNSFTVRE